MTDWEQCSFMMQKLYALVAGTCAADNPDSPQFQEVLLGGHLYLSIIKVCVLDVARSSHKSLY